MLQQSFLFEGSRVFPLADDALISMQYARNLASGAGLVWSGTDRVEGFTNFGWTLWMSLPHLLGISRNHTGIFVLLSNLVFNLLVIGLVWREAGRIGGRRAALVAGSVMAASLPLLYWALAGFEFSLIAFLLTLSSLACVRWIRGDVAGRRHVWMAVALPGLAYVVRPEAALFVPISLAAVALARRRRGFAVRSFSFLDLLGALALAVAFMLSLHLFRWKYYGELWPNTAYLKLGGGARGSPLYYLARLVPDSLFPMMALVWAYTLRYERRALEWQYVSCLLSVWLVWIFLSGGDAFGFARFFLPILPTLSVFASLAAVRLWPVLTRGEGSLHALAVAAVLVIVGLNFAKTGLLLANLQRNRSSALEQRKIIRELEAVLPPNALVAVAWAGASPYFAERLQFVDVLGKCNKHIARTLAHKGQPVGHNKWDIEYVMSRRPAAILEGGPVPWTDSQEFRLHYAPNQRKLQGAAQVEGYWLRK